MKAILLLFGLSVIAFSCTKKGNVCHTCVITKSIQSATVSKYTKDTVIHCGDNEQDINSFINANRRVYKTADSSYISDIYCK